VAHIEDTETTVEGLEAKPRWSLPAAILWVGRRRLDRVAESLAQIISKDPIESVWAWAVLQARGEASATRPDLELMAALRLGDVKASGLFEGKGRRQPISAEEWEDLVFGTVHDDGSAAHRGGPLAQMFGGYWKAVRFDQADLVRVFPTVSTQPAHEGPPSPARRLSEAQASREWDAWIAKCLADGMAPTIEECVQYGTTLGRARDWVRDKRKLLPAAMKNAPGQRAK